MARHREMTYNDETTVLRLIRDSVRERGYPPSQREIAAACGWESPSGANTLVKLMGAKGLIRFAPGIPRGLQVTEQGEQMIAETTPV